MTIYLAQWKKSAFVAGHLILDFLNTVDSEGRTNDCNRLTSHEALAAWCQIAGVITPSKASRITTSAIASPAQAEQVLKALIAWREIVHRALTAILRQESVAAEDWFAIETSVKNAVIGASLNRDTAGITGWQVISVDLTTIQNRLALHLIALLGSKLIATLKKCEGCTWLFIDGSKNHRRRWCVMSTCGSRCKAQRFRQGNGLSQ